MGDELIIFDAGSGIRDLGIEVMAGKVRKLHLFITHTHWDRIQGFPFFIPAYVPGFELTIYGSKGFGKNLKDIFHGQLDRDYFPAQMEDMRSTMVFYDRFASELESPLGVIFDPLYRMADQGGTVRDTELFFDVSAMGFDSASADAELRGDVFGGHAFADQREDFQLAIGE